MKLGILADCIKNVPDLHKDALLCEPRFAFGEQKRSLPGCER